jgi:sulfite reductase alpha subunit-like flavoprotein
MRTLEASLDELYPPPAPLPPAIDPNEPYAPRVVLVPSNRPVDAPAGPWAEVRTNARMTADEWAQDVRHVVLALDDSVSYVYSGERAGGSLNECRYEPGDVAAIYPEADPDAVDAFLDACGWAADADTPFDLHPAPGTICTLL